MTDWHDTPQSVLTAARAELETRDYDPLEVWEPVEVPRQLTTIRQTNARGLNVMARPDDGRGGIVSAIDRAVNGDAIEHRAKFLNRHLFKEAQLGRDCLDDAIWHLGDAVRRDIDPHRLKNGRDRFTYNLAFILGWQRGASAYCRRQQEQQPADQHAALAIVDVAISLADEWEARTTAAQIAAPPGRGASLREAARSHA